VRERKAGAFYACEAEGCGFDEPAGDLESYPVTTEVTEEARQAALAAAVAPLPKKRAPRRKPAVPEADAVAAEAKKAPSARRPAAPKPRKLAARKATAAASPKRKRAN
jgi:hypothetical protein